MDDRTIDALARLARLEIDPKTGHQLGEQLTSILNHFDILQELNTEDVAPAPRPLDHEAPRREDKPLSSDCIDALRNNAPLDDEGHIEVPRVIE